MMRFSRRDNGRLYLDLLDEPDYDLARNVSRAIVTTFRGVQKKPLFDVDGSCWLDIEIAGVMVTVLVNPLAGTGVFAHDESANGVLCDITNYLRANGKALGISSNWTA